MNNTQPTLIILPGLATPHHDFHQITQVLSPKIPILFHHRPGYTTPLPDDTPLTTKNIAQHLNNLIKTQPNRTPLILLGHSFGGLCVQHFARLYPEKVAAVILAESVSTDAYKIEQLDLPILKQGLFQTDKKIAYWRTLSTKTPEEIREQLQPKLLPRQTEFPPEIQQKILDFALNPNLYKAIASEHEHMYQSGEDIKNCGDFPSVPLKILVRDRQTAINSNIANGIPEDQAVILEDMWQELTRSQVNLSNQSELIEAPQGNHRIYLSNPELVIQVIEDLIKQIR